MHEPRNTKGTHMGQWHQRFGHISISGLERLEWEGLVDGLTIDESSIASPTCESCIQVKQAHRPFPKEAEHRSEIAGEWIVGDVWGPARVQSIGGWSYYVSFLDDAKRLSTVLFLKRKSDAFQWIREYGAIVEWKFGKPPRYMCFDNGRELVNPEIRKWASEKGIIIETMAPYSPSQNSIMEHFNRTLLELTHAMLIEKWLPAFLWDEAVAHAVYLRNRAPMWALKGMTPIEAWSGTKANVSHLREFGCDVWILDEDKNRLKLAPKSKKMVFTSFEDGLKAVQYYNAATWKIKVLQNFAFNENEEPRLETSSNVPGLPAEGEPAKVTDQSHDNGPNQADHKEESDTQPAETQRLCTREKDINYRKLHNPQA